MKLDNLKNLTIADIIEFAPFMKLPMSEALPKVREYIAKHGLEEKDARCIAEVVRALGLYK